MKIVHPTIILSFCGVSSLLMVGRLPNSYLRATAIDDGASYGYNTLDADDDLLDTEPTCLIRRDDVTRYRDQHQTWKDAKVPILSSRIPRDDESTQELLFVMKGLPYDDWVNEKVRWVCEGEPKRHRDLPKDPHGHTLTISCPKSSRTLTVMAEPGAAIRSDMINMTVAKYALHSGDADSDCLQWRATPVRKSVPDHHLAACTMVRGYSDREIAPWIEYHHGIGVEHFYVYVNEGMGTLPEQLRYYTDHKKFLTLIPFDFPIEEPFFYQQAMQNDCIQRFRDSASWITLSDIDEYFEVMKHDTPGFDGELGKFMRSHNPANSTGVQIPNWFFGRHPRKQIKLARQASNPLERYIYRTPNPHGPGSREKCIISPRNVQYFSVHMVTLSTYPTKRLDQGTLRMCHYKDPEIGIHEYYDPSDIRNLVLDESMKNTYGYQLELRLEKFRTYQKFPDRVGNETASS